MTAPTRGPEGRGPSRREVLAVGALAPAVLALGAPPRPRRRLWVLLAGAPAAVDLVSAAARDGGLRRGGTRAGRSASGSGGGLGRAGNAGRAPGWEPAARVVPGWGGAARGVWTSPSPFAPCGALTDALPSIAARGGRAVLGLTAPCAEPAAAQRAVERALGPVPSLERPLEAPAAFAAGARELRVRVGLDWGRLAGLPERAAVLDAELALLLRELEADGAGATELVLVGPCGRAPHARIPGRREPTLADPLFVVLGLPAARAGRGETLLARIEALRGATAFDGRA